MLFLLLSIEYAGLFGSSLYILIILFSAAYVLRPTVVLWIPLFGWFAYYTIETALHPDRLTKSDWIIFVSLGLAPAVSLLLAWPRKNET